LILLVVTLKGITLLRGELSGILGITTYLLILLPTYSVLNWIIPSAMVLMVLSALGENSYIRKQQKSSFVFSAWVLLSFIHSNSGHAKAHEPGGNEAKTEIPKINSTSNLW